ncbi:TetR/AcrR family transcriptional regulator [Maribacter polysaccharolyticus]|uniref:TetR/AcrR family transcriptional regulator n=1 Tax=Maribacter polysaccharolyticus TaxID=3020831 RepID=UPI00237F4DE1|nr:TetR family transcriptional regulator [Maribacter polysaccharolyticus]MDE3741139.1 TetR family transcriptional regulator [Maribacter polysaccharolyticus]
MNMRSLKVKDQILRAANEIFQAKGLHGSRMQEIADLAEVNKSLIHYYFKNKQTLYEMVFNNVFYIVAPQIDDIINDESTIEDKIRRFSSNYFAFKQKHPHLSNFVIHELNENGDFFDSLKTHPKFPNIEKFKIQVEREIRAGILIPINPEQLFIHILSLNIFPCMAEPFIRGLTNSDPNTYKSILKTRKTEVADFIINSIKRK